MPTPRASAIGAVGVPVAATHPSPEEACLLEQAVPPPATRVMIPEFGLMRCRTPLMSSLTSTFPNGPTTSPQKAPTPKVPVSARHPSPKASVDTTPAGRFGHCVPAVAVIGED